MNTQMDELLHYRPFLKAVIEDPEVAFDLETLIDELLAKATENDDKTPSCRG